MIVLPRVRGPPEERSEREYLRVHLSEDLRGWNPMCTHALVLLPYIEPAYMLSALLDYFIFLSV